MSTFLQQIIARILNGECMIFPTETLYAIGGDSLNPQTATRIRELKGRPEDKPLPLIIGDISQLERVTTEITSEVLRLARSFWPGPLSVLVKARPEFPATVKDDVGYTSVRWTPHTLAAKLCLDVGRPLIATSANISGRPAAVSPDHLDKELLERVPLAFLERPWPQGGLPSTVVRILGPTHLKIIRPGAIPADQLTKAGFDVY